MNELQTIGSYENKKIDLSRNETGRTDIMVTLWKRKWIIVLSTFLCLLLAAVATHFMTKYWRGEAQLLLVQRPVAANATADPNYTAPIPETMETQVGMLKTSEMAERAIIWMKKEAYAEGKATSTVTIDPVELQDALVVNNPLDSELINVSEEAKSRELAAAETNAYVQAFAEWKKELAQRDMEVAENTLQSRTNGARNVLMMAEQQQAAYELKHHLVDIARQQQGVLDQFQGRSTDVAGLQQALQSATARMDTLASQLQKANATIRGGKGVRDETLVLSLQSKLNDLEMQRADQAQKVTAAYPGVLSNLDAQIADLKKRFARAVQSTVGSTPSLQSQGALVDAYQQAKVQVAATKAQLRTAQQTRDQASQQMTSMPQTGMDYSRLVRNTQMATLRYRTLQSALESAHIEKDRITGNVRVTQSATVPWYPARPGLLKDSILGALAGLFLSILAVALIENADRRVRSIAEVRQMLNGQIVGTLPQLSLSEVQQLSTGFLLPEVAEAFSLVRVNLALAMRGRSLGIDLDRHQTILVTSAMPGEGKSLTAAQVARSIADLGKRVVLVDANIRRPSSDSIFKQGKTSGLADILAGEKMLEEVLVLSDIKNLLLLHSGTTVYNPTDLLSHARLGDTLRALHQRADVVVIDAPDCTTVADTAILTPYADCLLQVIRLGHCEREAMSETARALEATGKTTVFLINGKTPVRSVPKNVPVFASFTNRPERSLLNGMPVEGNGMDKTMVMSAASGKEHEHFFAKSAYTDKTQHSDLENNRSKLEQ